MTPLKALVLRDLLLSAIAALLWTCLLIAGGADNTGMPFLQAVTGLMTVLPGYLLHEWGHLIGAWASGSRVQLPERAWRSVFLFRFDIGRNSREQFLAMSAGGFIASVLVVAFLLTFLPAHLLASHVALGLTLLGVLATFILEIPPAWRVYHGGPMPDGSAFVNTAEK